MKPFNLEAAKAGAPVKLSDGTESVRIICTDRKGPQGPILALIGSTDHEYAWAFSADGKRFEGGSVRLVMAPIGTLAGRDVYPSDEVQTASGPMVVGNDWHQGDLNNCNWPRKYPETRMDNYELAQAWTGVNQPQPPLYDKQHQTALNVANAAIKHGIDNGYLFAEGSQPDDQALHDAFYNDSQEMRFPLIDLMPRLRRVWNVK